MWKVVPICERQMLDVKKEDLLSNGWFRQCDSLHAGGGYDEFSRICESRLGVNLRKQFIVQLYGCILNCPYCYVTKDGIWGEYKEMDSYHMVEQFVHSGLEVFHLMGGAPFMNYRDFPKLIEMLSMYRFKPNVIFHSDILLVESDYDATMLLKILSYSNALYAVNIKGTDNENWFKNTMTESQWSRFFSNLDKLWWANTTVRGYSRLYLTFTNPSEDTYQSFVNHLVNRYGSGIMDDSFVIPLIDYNAVRKEE